MDLTQPQIKYKSLQRPFLKSVSLVLVQAFLFQQIAFAAPELTPVKVDIFEKPLVHFKLPESVALIEDAYKVPGSSKTVILFQDAHTNESAQLNLARALDTVIKRQKVKYVFSEAGVGDNSLGFLRSQAALEKRKQVAMAYLRKGILHGAEYLDVTSDADFMLWGVEDAELYGKSLAVYREVAKQRETFQAYLTDIESTVGTLKPRIYSPSLLAFDAVHENYLKEKISLTEYFDALLKAAEKRRVDLSHFPHLEARADLKRQEAAIDFKKANEEQGQAFGRMGQEHQKQLLELSSEAQRSPFRVSANEHKEDKAFYAVLEDKIGLGLALYPELSKYLRYLKVAKNIQAKDILAEQRAMENEVLASLQKTDDERSLWKASRNLRDLKKLFNLTLTSGEFDAYREDPRGYDLAFITGFLNRKITDLGQGYEKALLLEGGYDTYIRKCEEFYLLTYQRDQVFVEKLLAKMEEAKQSEAALMRGG